MHSCEGCIRSAQKLCLPTGGGGASGTFAACPQRACSPAGGSKRSHQSARTP